MASDFAKIKMNIVSVNNCNFNDVVAYDEQHFYTRREKLLQCFIAQDNVLAFAYIENNTQIRGLVVVSQAPDTYHVGPLFADNSTIAKLLVYQLSLELPDKICSIDMPLINKNIYELINQFGMVEGSMRSIRMHKGEILLKNPEQIYGHLSIELG
jgi:hypothetical protein